MSMNDPDTGNTPFHVITHALELALEQGHITPKGLEFIAELIYDDAPNQPDELPRFQLEFVAARLHHASMRFCRRGNLGPDES